MTENSQNTLKREAIGVQSIPEPETATPEINKIKASGRTVYRSKKSQAIIYNSKLGDANLALNCLAHDANKEPITCRHLAYYVALKSMKNYHDDLGNLKNIATQDLLKNNVFDKARIAFQSTYYNVFEIDKFGLQLERLAKCLNQSEQCSLMLRSESHAMSITIRHKKNGQFIIKFYDPNLTNTHVRIICKDINQIRLLSFKDFSLNLNVDTYFPTYKSAVLFSPNQTSKNELPFIEMQEENWKANLYYSLIFGLSTKVVERCNAILTLDVEDQIKVELLCAKHQDREVFPGLLLSLKFGQRETVKLYIETIVFSKLADHAKAQLIAAKSKSGVSTLLVAFCIGDQDTIKWYVDFILNSNLAYIKKTELIDNTLGLLMALYNMNFHESVKTYTDSILNSTLDDSTKAELVAPKNDNGTPWLHDALSSGHHKTISAYMESILTSTLNEDKKAEILAAKRPDGRPWLFIALHEGHHETVNLYVKTIKRSTLSTDTKAELLKALNIEGSNKKFILSSKPSLHPTLKILNHLVLPTNLLELAAKDTPKGANFRAIITRVEDECNHLRDRLSKSASGKNKLFAFLRVEKDYRRDIYAAAFKGLTGNTDVKADLAAAEAKVQAAVNIDRHPYLRKMMWVISNLITMVCTFLMANIQHKNKTDQFFFFSKPNSSQDIHRLGKDVNEMIHAVPVI